MTDNVQIIAFFSAAGVFRKKTEETQFAALEASWEAFQSEFGEGHDIEDIWGDLCDYMAKRDSDKRKREESRLIKQARKAEAEAAKPIAAGANSADEHIANYGPGLYILTVAQNNTYADAEFLGALETYAARHSARLLVAQTTYNKSGYFNPNDQQETWFDPALADYYVEGQIDLGGAHFIADANVIVTAKWPTSGFGAETPAGVHSIIPSSKIELRVMAALKGDSTKVIAGTGIITKRNYIMRKAGAQAANAHCIAALLVDTRGDKPVLRHLHQVDGESGFYDIDGQYQAGSFKPLQIGDVAALQPGDIHAEKMEQANLDRILGLIDRFKPDNLIAHDILDFSSRNHHNIKDPLFIHKQMVVGNSVRGDLQKLANVTDQLAEAIFEHDGNFFVIESNHDLAINTWLKTADPKNDPRNALVYHTCMKAIYEFQENGNGGYFNMLQYAYEAIGEGRYNDEIIFHETDTSVKIAGIEMGNHGHNGANGAKGNPKGFAALGVPINTGHTHSPSIYWPCFTAGVMASLDMGYNIGASSWAIADILTYANGQRQILFA